MSDSSTSRDLSRRLLVKGAAAGAAVGSVVAMAGPAAASTTARRDLDGEPQQASAQPIQETASAQGSVVVHVRDAARGELDVYTETGHFAVTDAALAARLSRLAR